MKLYELIGSLVSHNETINLWVQNDGHKIQLWDGPGHQLPEEYKNREVIKIFGAIPLTITSGDRINILIRPEIKSIICTYVFTDLKNSKNDRIYPDDILADAIMGSSNRFIYDSTILKPGIYEYPGLEDIVGIINKVERDFDTGEIKVTFEVSASKIPQYEGIKDFGLCTCCQGTVRYEDDKAVVDTKEPFKFVYFYLDKEPCLSGYYESVEVIYYNE